MMNCPRSRIDYFYSFSETRDQTLFTRMSRRTRSFRSFYCFTKHSSVAKFGHELFSKIILRVFVVWKKLVLVKRRAVDKSVCLWTIEQAEPAELTIQVNAARISLPLTTDKRRHYAIHLSG